MDRWKFFAICHTNMAIYNPLGSAKLDEIVELCDLPATPHVLDIACGNGEFLRRLARRWGATGTGVDLSPPFVQLAREMTKASGFSSQLSIIEGNGAEFEAPPESFDLVSCLGASWIWNGYDGALDALAHWAKPGAVILAGEPFFCSDPPPDSYLKAQALARDSFRFGSHRDNALLGRRKGLLFLTAIVASHDDWDHYEGYLGMAAERYAQAHPDDPDVPELLALQRGAQEAYLDWGRDGLGWAVYVYMKPKHAG